ncbi:MAG: T9SS type A sorting domain-containing protein [Ignavibacteria bacterium]|nr:T9SS type A sorting domain-containing protein [Ignavibacteria bacterium]
MKKFSIFLLLFVSSVSNSQWNQTLDGISIWSVAKDHNGYIYAGSLGSSSKLYKTTNTGFNWSELTTGNSQTIFSIAVDSMNNIFAANFSAGLLKSTNNGANFTTMPVSSFGSQNPQAVACGKKGRIYVGTNGGGFYRSIDTGATFTFTGLASAQVISIVVDKYNSAIVYVGVTTAAAGPNGFYRSTDYGATFSANLNPGKNIYGILQKSPNDLFTVSTTAGGPVDKSTNGGLNWTTAATGYIGRGIADGDLSGHIYISGNGGVFYSTNGGVTFINDNLTFSANQIVKSGNYMFAALSGATNGGVWVRAFPLGIHNVGNEVPENFSLSQNYPNPFNPSTKIRFQLPIGNGRDRSKLTIYDLLGREIITLVNENLAPGTYEVEWDAAELPAGIYHYVLNYGDRYRSRKMILIK